MTAQAAENEQARQAVAAGEAAAAAHAGWAEAMQSSISGSEVAVEQPSTPDDVDPGWFGTSSTPPAVSPQPHGAVNEVAVEKTAAPHSL